MIENLGLFFYTLIADDKYSLPNKDKLLQLIQMQLSRKQKTFSQFFPPFWNLHRGLNIFK